MDDDAQAVQTAWQRHTALDDKGFYLPSTRATEAMLKCKTRGKAAVCPPPNQTHIMGAPVPTDVTRGGDARRLPTPLLLRDGAFAHHRAASLVRVDPCVFSWRDGTTQERGARRSAARELLADAPTLERTLDDRSSGAFSELTRHHADLVPLKEWHGISSDTRVGKWVPLVRDVIGLIKQTKRVKLESVNVQVAEEYAHAHRAYIDATTTYKGASQRECQIQIYRPISSRMLINSRVVKVESKPALNALNLAYVQPPETFDALKQQINNSAPIIDRFMRAFQSLGANDLDGFFINSPVTTSASETSVAVWMANHGFIAHKRANILCIDDIQDLRLRTTLCLPARLHELKAPPSLDKKLRYEFEDRNVWRTMSTDVASKLGLSSLFDGAPAKAVRQVNTETGIARNIRQVEKRMVSVCRLTSFVTDGVALEFKVAEQRVYLVRSGKRIASSRLRSLNGWTCMNEKTPATDHSRAAGILFYDRLYYAYDEIEFVYKPTNGRGGEFKEVECEHTRAFRAAANSMDQAVPMTWNVDWFGKFEDRRTTNVEVDAALRAYDEGLLSSDRYAWKTLLVDEKARFYKDVGAASECGRILQKGDRLIFRDGSSSQEIGLYPCGADRVMSAWRTFSVDSTTNLSALARPTALKWTLECRSDIKSSDGLSRSISIADGECNRVHIVFKGIDDPTLLVNCECQQTTVPEVFLKNLIRTRHKAPMSPVREALPSVIMGSLNLATPKSILYTSDDGLRCGIPHVPGGYIFNRAVNVLMLNKETTQKAWTRKEVVSIALALVKASKAPKCDFVGIKTTEDCVTMRAQAAVVFKLQPVVVGRPGTPREFVPIFLNIATSSIHGFVRVPNANLQRARIAIQSSDPDGWVVRNKTHNTRMLVQRSEEVHLRHFPGFASTAPYVRIDYDDSLTTLCNGLRCEYVDHRPPSGLYTASMHTQMKRVMVRCKRLIRHSHVDSAAPSSLAEKVEAAYPKSVVHFLTASDTSLAVNFILHARRHSYEVKEVSEYAVWTAKLSSHDDRVYTLSIAKVIDDIDSTIESSYDHYVSTQTITRRSDGFKIADHAIGTLCAHQDVQIGSEVRSDDNFPMDCVDVTNERPPTPNIIMFTHAQRVALSTGHSIRSKNTLFLLGAQVAPDVHSTDPLSLAIDHRPMYVISRLESSPLKNEHWMLRPFPSLHEAQSLLHLAHTVGDALFEKTTLSSSVTRIDPLHSEDLMSLAESESLAASSTAPPRRRRESSASSNVSSVPSSVAS